MKEDKQILADDFIEDPDSIMWETEDDSLQFTYAQVKRFMINFAIAHKNAALETAYNNAELREFTKEDSKNDNYICHTSDDYGDAYVLDENSILNAYPDELIK